MSPTTVAPPVAAAGAPAADPLAALRGIHTPEAIGFWPPAPGWWALAAVAVAALVLAAIAVRRHRASLARRVLAELDQIAGQHADLHALAAQISSLLRRVALLRFGRRAARLHGDAWQAFLTEHAPRGRRRQIAAAAAALSSDLGRTLALAPYAPPGALALAGSGADDRAVLLSAARAWIRGNL